MHRHGAGAFVVFVHDCRILRASISGVCSIVHTAAQLCTATISP
jgi:hypothetical protein